MEIAQHRNRGQEQARRATSPEGEAAAHRSLELHVDREAWVEGPGGVLLSLYGTVHYTTVMHVVMMLLWVRPCRPWWSRSRRTGDVTNPTQPILLEAFCGLVLSCLVLNLTCPIPGVTGQQDLAPARASLMTAVAITLVG